MKIWKYVGRLEDVMCCNYYRCYAPMYFSSWHDSGCSGTSSTFSPGHYSSWRTHGKHTRLTTIDLSCDQAKGTLTKIQF